MSKQTVIVIGAGPAGLMAAGQTALNYPRKKVMLIEKMPEPGIKLALTGNGRCNLTNAMPIQEFKQQIWTNFKWLKHALFSFTNQNLRDFFQNLGIQTTIEAEQKIFPKNQKAADIVKTLVQWNLNLEVEILTNTKVTKLLLTNEPVMLRSFQSKISGVEIESMKDQTTQTLNADQVIITTGGMSYPKTGSTGDGYQLAKSVGHTIIPIQPILVAMETKRSLAQQLQGLSLSGVTISAWVNGRKIAQEYGDILFTHFGISGPAVLALSQHIVIAINQQQEVMISLDLFPEENDQALDKKLLQMLNNHNNLYVINALKGICPTRLLPICLEKINLLPEKRVNQVSAIERKKLRYLLKNFQLPIKALRPISEAIVTRGGISTTEIDPKTMASKLVNGLYFAGEILDVDANTGGFNLQIAFSTGWLAGFKRLRQNYLEP
ncbi:MAG: NAD(P)/FAD-dependent oxidoreductase [Candidatus Margulisiibacteriota bacterium]